LSKWRQFEQRVRQKEDELERSRLINAPPSLPLAHFCGDYEDAQGKSGCVNVRVQDSGLTLSFAGEGAFDARLASWHHDTFRLCAQPGVAEVLGPTFVTFEVGPQSEVTSLSMLNATFHRRSH
jgi:hypothetical protein